MDYTWTYTHTHTHQSLGEVLLRVGALRHRFLVAVFVVALFVPVGVV